MATTGTRLRRFGRRSVVAGGLAGAAMLGFYVAVVAGVSGSWTHLGDQVALDWYLIMLVAQPRRETPWPCRDGRLASRR